METELQKNKLPKEYTEFFKMIALSKDPKDNEIKEFIADRQLDTIWREFLKLSKNNNNSSDNDLYSEICTFIKALEICNMKRQVGLLFFKGLMDSINQYTEKYQKTIKDQTNGPKGHAGKKVTINKANEKKPKDYNFHSKLPTSFISGSSAVPPVVSQLPSSLPSVYPRLPNTSTPNTSTPNVSTPNVSTPNVLIPNVLIPNISILSDKKKQIQ